MSKNLSKKVIGASVLAAAMAFSGGAYAFADLTASPATYNAKFASELTTAGATLTNNAALLSTKAAVGWGVSAGNHAYIRYDVTNATFNTALTQANMTSTNANVGVVTIVLSAGGASGASSVIFDLSNTKGVAITDDVTIAPADLNITDPTQLVTVQVRTYTDSTLAATGGASLATSSGTLASVQTGVKFSTTPANSIATLANNYKNFNSINWTKIGTFSLAADTSVYTTAGVALNANLSDLASAVTATATGDFSAVGLAPSGGAGANGLYLATTGNCGVVSAAAFTLNTGKSSGTATWAAGDVDLCFAVSGTTAITVQSDTISFKFTPAVGSTIAAIPNTNIGTISRDGTTLQSVWMSGAPGYTSRIFLTNTGTSPATIASIAAVTESGNTCTAGTGAPTSIPANSLIQIPMSQICASFSGNTRTAVVVNIQAPTTQIKGTMQIIDPTSGAQAVSAMVLP